MTFQDNCQKGRTNSVPQVSKETANITGNLKIENITVNNETEICELELNGDLEIGEKYVLELDFSGTVNSDALGTNFKGGNARLAFPCFDEPRYKTLISLQIQHLDEYGVIGGTRVKSRNSGVTSFETTPFPINADNLGFALYQNLTKSSMILNPIEIYSSFNVNVSLTTLTTMMTMRDIHEKFFGNSLVTIQFYIATPFIPKKPQIDNLGLSVVNQLELLRGPIISTPEMYQKTLQMYSHQFTLNWIEYDVTPDTWNEWWLSRGLAKFYDYYTPSQSLIFQIFIDWNQFVTHNTHKALDAFEGTPIQSDPIEGVKNNERAAAIFNMIQSVIGIDNFNAGIKQYVKLFTGKSVNSTDLFGELANNVQEPLPADLHILFEDWFRVDYYPLVNVSINDNTVSIKQALYNFKKSDLLLYIPISYVTTEDMDFEDTSPYDWIQPDPNFELKIEDFPEDSFILLNKQQTGFYRVLYDESNYDLLLDLLMQNHTIIHPLNRAQLIDDLGSFTRNGYIDYSVFFSFLKYLEFESDYIVWSVVNKHINYLYHKLRSSEAFGRYETFVREITKAHFDEFGLGIGLEIATHRERLNRKFVAELACYSGVDTCVNETMEYVEDLRNNSFNVVFPEMIPIMACTVFKFDYKVLDILLDYLQTPANESVEEKGVDLLKSINLSDVFLDGIIDTLGCSRNESSLRTTLDLSIIPAKKIDFTISRPTRRKLFETVVKGSHMGTVMGLKFIKEHYLAMNQRYDNMALVFQFLKGYILTEELLEMYTEVVRIYEAKFYPESVKLAAYETMEASKIDVEWTNTYVNDIESWLSDNDYNGTTTEKPNNGNNLKTHIGLLFYSIIGHSFDPYPDFYETDYLKKSVIDSSLLAEGTENFRINDDCVPSFYKLTIIPYINEHKHFDGEVEIDFMVTKQTQTIVLNQEHLKIHSYSLYDMSNEIFLQDCKNIDEYQKLECTLFNQTLQIGAPYRLILTYTGTIHDDMRGFYESYYYDEKREKKVLGTTHFGQQTRRLMPCFDEPKFKAHYQLNIGHNNETHPITISNAQLLSTIEVNDTWVIDEYKETSLISTYILAFVISDFDEISDNIREEHTFAVYARPNAIEQADFAYQIGPKLIKEFDKWNGISYYEFQGVEKMDIAAIPDFSAGAMENWGMLLHRETNLLVDDHHTNALQRQRIALVISHEIAHMWFGNLVTCDWFDAIWLNEGFATYFEFVALDPVQPDWNVMDDFVVSTMHNSLIADGQRSSHPLTNPGVNSYTEIRTLFSTITYDKGGSILRMMHNIMGLGKFQNAIKSYLDARKYSTAKPEDLFKELEKEDPTVSPVEIMGSYTQQPGYPLVSVKRVGDSLKLTQKRFLIDQVDHNITTRWTIPITVVKNKIDFSDKKAHLTLFHGLTVDELEIPINGTTLDFYMLNVQQVGYYRVNYDTENWRAISRAIKSENHDGIHLLNRAQIVDDLFNLARVGYLSYDFILEIIDYIKTEKHYLPWYATLNGLSYLQQRIPDQNYKNEFDSFVRNLLEDIYDYLDFKSHGSHQDKLNRINILNWACKYGNEKCIAKAKEEFENVINKNQNIDPDWKLAVYCTGLRETEGNWDKLWDRYVQTNYATEQATVLTALGCTKNEAEIHKFLEKILTDDIRLQDKSAAYNRAYSGNLESVDYVLDYITKNYEKWDKVMDLGSTLSDLANRFTNDQQIEKLDKFIKDTNLEENVKMRLTSAIDRSRKNIEWDTKRLSEVEIISVTINYVER
uniref:CSON013169 protein n=1 Tax=Culicoides sonorensis TaxID=179676 RepID=A0A336M823_CULSO